MWLLDTESITISWQDDDSIQYAILSHRWDTTEEEVSFTDIQNPKVARRKKGYKKIKWCCKQAWRDGYNYAWVDTCCIDKSSSAELQEAINSMYRWYEKSGVCYAYLRDVPSVPLDQSRWFTRGWTLQELLAPKSVEFYDLNWNPLGAREKLVDSIHKATSIRKDLILGKMNVHDCCIAERMSWASKRETTRIEDRAYSLFGIFQVHLPMLYGEREASFRRLQQEILKTSEDDTLFAWTGVKQGSPGLLAPNLEAFKDGTLLRADTPLLKISGTDTTERRVGITTELFPWSLDTYLIILGCKRVQTAGRANPEQLGIYVRSLEDDGEFARIKLAGADMAYITDTKYFDLTVRGSNELDRPYIPVHPSTWAMRRSISVRQLLLPLEHSCFKERLYGFKIAEEVSIGKCIPYLPDFLPWEAAEGDGSDIRATWDEDQRILKAEEGACLVRGVVGAIELTRYQRKVPMDVRDLVGLSDLKDIHLGFDHSFNPTILIRKRGKSTSNRNIDSFCSWCKGREFCESIRDMSEEKAEEADFWDMPKIPPSFPRSEERSFVTIARKGRGFWALKGDRKRSVSRFALDNDGQRQVSLVRRHTEEEIAWEFSITGHHEGNFFR